MSMSEYLKSSVRVLFTDTFTFVLAMKRRHPDRTNMSDSTYNTTTYFFNNYKRINSPTSTRNNHKHP